MMGFKRIAVAALLIFSCALQGQSFDQNWLESHPKEAVDSIGTITQYHNYYRDDQRYYKAVVDTMLAQFVQSDLDSIWISLAYKQAYKVISKRDLKPYFKRIRAIADYAPKDSVHLYFFSKYMIGNAYIFNEDYDSAAFYLNAALDYDEKYDLGPYEGAVSERLSIIFYRLGDYNRSLEFAQLALKDAQENLRGAVYNQMANTYALSYEYEKAAAAYDSAAFYYELVGNRGWWMPIYNSMTTHLELRDSSRFLAAYNRIKDVPYVKESGEFHHLINMSKAEFSLTEWQRATDLEGPGFGGMVLPKTPENEQWVRQVLQRQISYTEGEWRDYRDAIYLLKRWYDMCRPDSVVYAYERILALDRAYADSKQFNPKSSYLESGNVVELQNLVSRISYSMLNDRLKQVSDLRRLLIRESQNISLFGVLLLLTFYGLWRIRRLRKERKHLNEDVRSLKDREEILLRRLLPDHQYNAWKRGEKTAAQTYEDATVLRADLQGFSALIGTMNPDELLQVLEGYFSRFKEACARQNLQFVRTDGSSFIAIGGTSDAEVSPREALEAAFDMYKSTRGLNLMLDVDRIELGLRIGIHLGTVEAGAPNDRVVGFDYWGDVFEECRKIEQSCSIGEAAVSKKAFSLDIKGSLWPEHRTEMVGEHEVVVFNLAE